MLLRGICANELTLLGKQMWGVGAGTDTIEALACGRHVGWGDSDSFCGAMWILYSCWGRWRWLGRGVGRDGNGGVGRGLEESDDKGRAALVSVAVM